MPNSPSERDPGSAGGGGARLAAAARTPAGIVIAAVVVIAILIAISGLLGGVGQGGGAVVAASPSSSSPATAAGSSADPTPIGQATTSSEGPGPSAGAGTAPPGSQPSGPQPTATDVPPAPPDDTSSDPSIPAVALQARLEKIRTKLKIPGVSVAILWDDGRRWLGASGMRNMAAEKPMTTGTAFALASISKTLTAAVVLQLVEEGQLSLDQKVAPLLPAFGLDSRITVRMLLDHTSGLGDYFLNVGIDRPLQRQPDAAWSAERTWAYVPKKHAKPGKRWIYSNANYLLLGELVTKVTGRPLSTEVRDRLLDPLGLETAWYQGVEEPRVGGTLAYRLVARAGGGVRYMPVAPAGDVMPFRSVVTAAAGAGSIAATALDAARWMQAWGGDGVVSAQTHQEMLADVARTTKLGAAIPYGLGIQALPIAGRPALGHSGRFLGFRNVARYLPEEGVTIAVLTNQGVQDPARIAEAMLKIVLPPLPGPSPSASTTP